MLEFSKIAQNSVMNNGNLTKNALHNLGVIVNDLPEGSG